MAYDDVIDGSLADIFSVMGRSATYNPSGMDPVSLKVILEKDVELQPGGYSSQVWEKGSTIEALLDDLGKEPDRDETIVIGSDTWTIQSIERNDGRCVKMVVS